MSADPNAKLPAPRPAPGFVRIVLTVLASFFGVRKRSTHEADTASVKPQHLIVAGLVGALVFVLTLVTLVRFIIAHA